MLHVLSRTIVGCAVVVLLLLQSNPAAAQESPPATIAAEPQVSKPELRKELLARMAKDQEARMQLMELMKTQPGKGSAAPTPEDPRIQELLRVDRENREWLKKQIAEIGWPGKSLVGEDGAHAAWLLVQHADDDPPFQKECLEKMQAVPKEEVSATDVAYLIDRVMVKESGKQRYGTQLKLEDGKWVPVTLAEPDRVDALRKEVGMPPLAEYLEMVTKLYSATPSQDAEKKPEEKTDEKSKEPGTEEKKADK
jgi:hypothetical protein